MDEKFGIRLRSPAGRHLTWEARIAVQVQVCILEYRATVVAKKFGISPSSVGRLVKDIPMIIGENPIPVLEAIERRWAKDTGKPIGSPFHRLLQLDGLAIALNDPKWKSSYLIDSLIVQLGLVINREEFDAYVRAA